MIFHRRPQAMWFIPLAKFPRRQEEQIRNCAPEAIQRYLFWSVTKNYKMIPDVPNILTVGQKAISWHFFRLTSEQQFFKN